MRDELVKEISTPARKPARTRHLRRRLLYLAADAGLKKEHLGGQLRTAGNPSQISSVIDYVRQNQVPAVFCESTVSDNPMRQVADATGARFGGVLYVDSSRSERPRTHLP